MYEGYSESNASGLITVFSGIQGTTARHVLKALPLVFPMILSIAQRHYFFIELQRILLGLSQLLD